MLSLAREKGASYIDCMRFLHPLLHLHSSAQNQKHSCINASCLLQALSVAGRAGYEYMGKVSFVHSQKRAVPVMDVSSLEEAASPPVGADAEHFTVLVTSSGHSFTKRCTSQPFC